ncbi:hypothetical protein ACC691_41605, partial [Rhizobium johnstonii]|uniref:hypothetical protein n=1 Tax=Rhizobium johnstonii TaxID=3019933 RepID=UPI003F98C005
DFVKDSLDYAVGKPLQEHFDVVGFDPRGVSRSTPVKCYDAADMDSFLYDIPAGQRGSDQWIAEQTAASQAFAAACD